MRQTLVFQAIAAVLLAMVASTALADDIGEAAYMDNCASCHGTAGDGDGPLASLLTVPVPPLNTLAQQNGGSFPMLLVVHTIDGRNDKRGHGSRMPVWGTEFKADALVARSPAADLAARGKILSVAYYLESIQK